MADDKISLESLEKCLSPGETPLRTSKAGSKKWDPKQEFRALDPDADGTVPMSKAKETVLEALKNEHFTQTAMNRVCEKMDKRINENISCEEFCQLVGSPRVRKIYGVASYVIQSPNQREEEKKSYTDYWDFCPPPLFIPLVTLLEIIMQIYTCSAYGIKFEEDTAPKQSPLIWSPHCRFQAWRYMSYMMIHAGVAHISMNCLFQVVLGVLMELVHSWWRVGLIYLAGVIFGAVAHSICDYDVFLCGASGGVYALLAAHLSNVILNYSEMEYGIIRIAAVLSYLALDFGLALYRRYGKGAESSTSYVAHLAGLLVGMLMGILVLRNLKQKKWEKIIWWISLGSLICISIFGIFWNIFYMYEDNYKGTDHPSCQNFTHYVRN